DLGVTWTNVTRGLIDRPISNIAFQGANNFLLAGENLFHTTNGGLNWSHTDLGSTVQEVLVHPKDHNLVVAESIIWDETDFRIAISTNGGLTWSKSTPQSTRWAVFDLQNPNVLYVGGTYYVGRHIGGGLFRSNDRGR